MSRRSVKITGAVLFGTACALVALVAAGTTAPRAFAAVVGDSPGAWHRLAPLGETWAQAESVSQISTSCAGQIEPPLAKHGPVISPFA